MINVLITDITSYKGIVFAKYLSKVNSVRIITSDSRSYSQWIRTKYAKKHIRHTSAKKDPERFLAEIIEIIQREHIQYLIPVNSDDIRILLKNKDHLFGTLDYMGDDATFSLLDDKKNLAKLATELSLPVPRDLQLSDTITRFPLVFKPTQSSSSKGVSYIHTAEQLTELRKNPPQTSYVLQEYIQGEGVGYSVFAKDGQIVAGCGHKRLAEYPVSGGSSTIRAYFEHPRMEEIAQQVIAHTRWSGYAMFEFKLTPQEEIFLIEINPRIWGSIHQSIAAGVNFPAILFQPEQAISSTNIKAITYLSPLHLLSLLGYTLKQGKIFTALRLWGKTFRGKADVSVWSDSRGYLSILLRLFV